MGGVGCGSRADLALAAFTALFMPAEPADAVVYCKPVSGRRAVLPVRVHRSPAAVSTLHHSTEDRFA
jgi:hypothetical protein